MSAFYNRNINFLMNKSTLYNKLIYACILLRLVKKKIILHRRDLYMYMCTWLLY